MIKPPALEPGDTIRLIAPSSPPNSRAALENAIMALESLGYRITHSDVIFARSGYLAGSDEDRALDFVDAYTEETSRAVLCVRGGYGATRFLKHVNWSAIQHPKIFMGFSDVTALSCALWKKCGFPSFSGPVLMSDLVGKKPDRVSWHHAVSLMNGERSSGNLIENPFNLSNLTALVPGESYGRLMGGNLSLICSLLGTPWMPDFDKSILYLEDIGEAPYRVDRNLTQLKNAGILEGVSGIILGDFGYSPDMRKNDEQQRLQTLDSVFEDRLTDLGVPVLANVPFGHIRPKVTIPFGVLVILDCNNRNIIVQESGVEASDASNQPFE